MKKTREELCLHACREIDDDNLEDDCVIKTREDRDTIYKEVLTWESTMNKLLGHDSLNSVTTKIEFLKAQNKLLREELNMIRKYVNADENESTYDEVVRKISLLIENHETL